MKDVVVTLKARKGELKAELARIEKALEALTDKPAAAKVVPTAEARANMSAGQKRRHAKRGLPEAATPPTQS